MKKEYDVLFTPCKIGNLEIKNRFVVPAMSFTDVITWSNHSQTENKIEDFLIRKAKPDRYGQLAVSASRSL